MQHTEREHIAMMSEPGNWPGWPVLPLINRTDDSSNLLQSRAGCMFAGIPNSVILCNMYAIPRGVTLREFYEDSKAKGHAIDYPSAVHIYDAGWRVD